MDTNSKSPSDFRKSFLHKDAAKQLENIREQKRLAVQEAEFRQVRADITSSERLLDHKKNELKRLQYLLQRLKNEAVVDESRQMKEEADYNRAEFEFEKRKGEIRIVENEIFEKNKILSKAVDDISREIEKQKSSLLQFQNELSKLKSKERQKARTAVLDTKVGNNIKNNISNGNIYDSEIKRVKAKILELEKIINKYESKIVALDGGKNRNKLDRESKTRVTRGILTRLQSLVSKERGEVDQKRNMKEKRLIQIKTIDSELSSLKSEIKVLESKLLALNNKLKK